MTLCILARSDRNIETAANLYQPDKNLQKSFLGSLTTSKRLSAQPEWAILGILHETLRMNLIKHA